MRVLENFSLDIRQGEIVAVMGPSGCGKSTLIRICAGLELPDEGNVEFEFKSEFQCGLSIAFQDHGLLEWLSVGENVRLAGELRGLEVAAKSIQEVLGKVGLADFADAYPDQLSGGMRSRAALARALLIPSSVVLLDEPFRSLDEVTALSVSIDASKLLRRRQQTVLFATHSIAEAVRVADRVVVVSGRPMAVVREFSILLGEDERLGIESSKRDLLVRAVYEAAIEA
ncbi:MAG: ATP-binding cassette domain-containing protein [Fimbriimonadaceae bacterium]